MTIFEWDFIGLVSPTGHTLNMNVLSIQLAIESKILSDMGDDLVWYLRKLHINLLCD